MVASRLIIPALAVALLGACSTPQSPASFSTASVGTGDAAKPRMAKSDPQSVKSSSSNTQGAGPARDATLVNPEAAVQKVNLTLSSVSDPTNKAYVIGPRDVLEVNVFKVLELSKTVQVSEAGTISYPLVGELQASGKTARQVEQDLTKTLGAKYLQQPQISVSVKEYNSHRITMDGAFKKSGVFSLAGGLTLLQATANAGGFDEGAEETVVLFRQSNGTRAVTKYDMGRIREGREEDVQLEAGDVLVAPTSSIKQGVNSMFKFLPLATLATLHL
jgi:polysaccharide export outer membrane protein